MTRVGGPAGDGNVPFEWGTDGVESAHPAGSGAPNGSVAKISCTVCHVCGNNERLVPVTAETSFSRCLSCGDDSRKATG